MLGLLISKDGILMHGSRLCVPVVNEMKKQIMEESHCTLYTVHPGSTKMYRDLRGISGGVIWREILLICKSLLDLSTNKSWTSMTWRIIATPLYPWVEVGAHYYEFCWQQSLNPKITCQQIKAEHQHLEDCCNPSLSLSGSGGILL